MLIEVQSVGRDITERKRSELALRESEARYRALVETQTEFVLRQLPEGRLTFVNEAYCRYVGKPREFLLSEAFNGLDMMVPEDRPRFEAHLRGLTPERPTAIMETRAILPDGVAALGALGRHRHLRRATGGSSELQSTGRDITDQKKGELALRESEARYRAVVEGQTEFILRLDPDGNLTFVNDAYCRYRGLDSGDRCSAASTTSPTIRPSSRSASARRGPASRRIRRRSPTSWSSPAPDGGTALGGVDRHGRVRAGRPARRNPGDRARRHRAQAGRAVAARQRGALPADRRERAAADRDHRRRPLLRPVRQCHGARGVRRRGGRHRPAARSRGSGWTGDQRAEIARRIESEGARRAGRGADATARRQRVRRDPVRAPAGLWRRARGAGRDHRHHRAQPHGGGLARERGASGRR